MKCREVTSMKSGDHEWKRLGGNRLLLIGRCNKCNTKQSVFTNSEGHFKDEKTDTRERIIARAKRAESSKKKKALKIGLKVLENNANDCVSKCIKNKVNPVDSKNILLNTPINIPVDTLLTKRKMDIPINTSSKKRRMD